MFRYTFTMDDAMDDSNTVVVPIVEDIVDRGCNQALITGTASYD